MDMNFLANTYVFKDIPPEEIEPMLLCLGAVERSYKKGETIYYAGQCVESLGLILSGSVYIQNDDSWGNTSIVDKAGPGQVFAETYACVPDEKLMVSVIAAENTRVLFLNMSKVLTMCGNACENHGRIIRNMLMVSSVKNLNLSRRIFHTSSKTIRGRLMSYLSYHAVINGKREFDIPFNRQQLADYLSVDRSAMSNELGKMQKDGLLKSVRNHFILKGENWEDYME
ncbi:MAG: Crp/Fnr family transcriptional regulator [Oscillospiraceae bacterium]|nr:Crp/Fnr family transcriptional regulator [Oscillospiraceae bacterium]